MEITKKDSNTIRVIAIETVTKDNDFSRNYLEEQRVNILAQKAQQIAERDKEIAEIDLLLGECVRLNVLAKPIEEIKQIITK